LKTELLADALNQAGFLGEGVEFGGEGGPEADGLGGMKCF